MTSVFVNLRIWFRLKSSDVDVVHGDGVQNVRPFFVDICK